MNVSLTPELEQFIKEQVDSGLYATASQVIRASLRTLEREEQQLGQLRAQMSAGREQIDQGEVVRESESFWADLNREVDSRIAKSKHASHVTS